jgi:hypothetical protein
MTEEDCLNNPKIEVTVTDHYEYLISVRNADQNWLQTVIINCNSRDHFPVTGNIVIYIYIYIYTM